MLSRKEEKKIAQRTNEQEKRRAARRNRTSPIKNNDAVVTALCTYRPAAAFGGGALCLISDVCCTVYKTLVRLSRRRARLVSNGTVDGWPTGDDWQKHPMRNGWREGGMG